MKRELKVEEYKVADVIHIRSRCSVYRYDIRFHFSISNHFNFRSVTFKAYFTLQKVEMFALFLINSLFREQMSWLPSKNERERCILEQY